MGYHDTRGEANTLVGGYEQEMRVYTGNMKRKILPNKYCDPAPPTKCNRRLE